MNKKNKLKIGIDIDDVIVNFIEPFLYFYNKKFHELELIEEFKNKINFLFKNYEVFFITARPLSIKEKTERFFEKSLKNKKYTIIYSVNYHYNNSYEGKSKVEICKSLGLSYFIEDNQYNALDCAKKGIKTFLINKPWINNLGIFFQNESKNNFKKVLDCIEKKENMNIKVTNMIQTLPKSIEVKDFVNFFKSRLNEMKNFLQDNSELNNLVSINKISGKKQNISIIGMVYSKKVTKNKNILFFSGNFIY